MIKKMLFLFIFGVVGQNSLFALSTTEKAFIWRAYQIRNAQDVEQNQKKFAYDLKKASTQITVQTNLIVKNLLILDEIPFLYQKNQAKKVYLAVTSQEKLCKSFIEKTPISKVDKWTYITCGDILSQGFAFAGGSPVERSKLIKSYYLTALKIDDKFSPAHISYGIWLYFAPAIAGGGLDASLKSFNKALQFATKDTEKYLAYIYRSQVYFAMNRNTEWDADLKSAHNIFPYESETFTKYVREKNSKQGLSLFAH